MPSRAVWKVVDFDGDFKEISVEGLDVVDGTSYGVASVAANALFASLGAITIGSVVKVSLVADEAVSTPALPATATAQTNIQWRARYTVTSTGAKRTLRIPTADLAGMPVQVINGVTLADLSQSPWTTFVTNFETFVRDGGLAVTLDSVEFYEG
jgi:hypothetical protein